MCRLLLCTLLFGIAAIASDQTLRAQVPVPITGPGISTRLRPPADEIPDYRLWLQGFNKKSLPKDFDAELYKKLMKELPPDQKPDPKQFEQMFEKNPQLKDPAFLQQLEQMLKSDQFPENLEQKLKNSNGEFPRDLPKFESEDQLKGKLEQAIESGRTTMPKVGPNGDAVTPPNLDPPKIDPSKLDPSKLDPKNGNLAGENEWVKWMEKNFGNSPAGQAAIKDLMSALEKQDVKGMFDQVPEFKNGGWKDLDSWGKANAGDLWKMKPPDLSGNRMTPPNIGGGSSGGGGFGGSSGGGFGGSGGGLEGGGTALAVIAGIAGAILLAVLILRKWKLNREQHATAGAPGVNPGIDFDSVRTREELVRAFNFVSLDQIGDEARAWNHRVIADQIADARPAQAEPAGELADLYERARYAPSDEDLTAGEFSSARHDLRVIAGVPA